METCSCNAEMLHPSTWQSLCGVYAIADSLTEQEANTKKAKSASSFFMVLMLT